MSAPLRPTLHLTRGLPGSGKSTWAAAWVAESDRRVRVNRDAIREMVHGGFVGDREHEDQVTDLQLAMVGLLMRRRLHIVCDDTNLDTTDRGMPHRLWSLAMQHDYEVVLRDFTHVSADECIVRDHARGLAGGRTVGPGVIRMMEERYLTGRDLPLPAPGPAPARTPW